MEIRKYIESKIWKMWPPPLHNLLWHNTCKASSMYPKTLHNLSLHFVLSWNSGKILSMIPDFGLSFKFYWNSVKYREKSDIIFQMLFSPYLLTKTHLGVNMLFFGVLNAIPLQNLKENKLFGLNKLICQ